MQVMYSIVFNVFYGAFYPIGDVLKVFAKNDFIINTV